MIDKLEFPFTGPQVILSSDRILLHSKKDAIILAGKRAVSLCSTETINLDAKEKIILDSPFTTIENLNDRTLGLLKSQIIQSNNFNDRIKNQHQELYFIFGYFTTFTEYPKILHPIAI